MTTFLPGADYYAAGGTRTRGRTLPLFWGKEPRVLLAGLGRRLLP